MQDICHSEGACKDSILGNVPKLNDLHVVRLLKNAGYGLSWVVAASVWSSARIKSLHGGKQIFGKLLWFFTEELKCEANWETVVRKQAGEKEKDGAEYETQRACGWHVSPSSSTWKTRQDRQTMDGWIIRCVRLLSEKVWAEIKCHFEHPTGVYWKAAGMWRMSAVWVCPWKKGAHKMCPRQHLKLS